MKWASLGMSLIALMYSSAALVRTLEPKPAATVAAAPSEEAKPFEGKKPHEVIKVPAAEYDMEWGTFPSLELHKEHITDEEIAIYLPDAKKLAKATGKSVPIFSRTFASGRVKKKLLLTVHPD